uniref:Evasin n=1 Tax=Rhipicephalus microplus TaxID=6941 RepID=A0A6G5A830_RHIMP
MAFKACITVIAVVYAVQLLCGASEENSNRRSSEYGSEYDYNDSCLYTYLNTSRNMTLVVNCTMECGEMLNNSLPCVNVTYPPLNFSNPHLNYTCTVGSCNNGTCPSNGTNTTCWAEFSEWVLGSRSNTSPSTLL